MIIAGLLLLSRPPPVTRSSMLVVVRRIGLFLTGGVPALHAQDTQLARSREGTVVRHQRAGTDRQCSRRLHRIRQLQPANGAKPSRTFARSSISASKSTTNHDLSVARQAAWWIEARGCGELMLSNATSSTLRSLAVASPATSRRKVSSDGPVSSRPAARWCGLRTAKPMACAVH